MISGLSPYCENGKPDINNIKNTIEIIAECGVSEKIIIHCKTAGFCYDVKNCEFTAVNSLDIPKEKIKGSVGAGDAFCAGSLYGIYNHYTDRELLEFASVAADASLFSENSIDGMKPRNELEKLSAQYKRLE